MRFTRRSDSALVVNLTRSRAYARRQNHAANGASVGPQADTGATFVAGLSAPPAVTAEDGRAVVAVIEAIYAVIR